MSEPPRTYRVSETEKPSDLFRRFLDYTGEVDRILTLSVCGISALIEIEPLVEPLANSDLPDAVRVKNFDPDPIHRARTVADLADSEVKQGFPLLHAHSLVAVWSALETLVQDLLVGLLLYIPEARQNPLPASIRVSIAEYLALDDDEERMRLWVEELERSVRTKFKAGVARFDARLDAVGFVGPVDADVRRELVEVYQVRNLIVHRSSVADQKFVKACPWKNVRPGQRVLITADDYNRYRTSIQKYVVGLMTRLIEWKKKKQRAASGEREEKPL